MTEKIFIVRKLLPHEIILKDHDIWAADNSRNREPQSCVLCTSTSYSSGKDLIWRRVTSLRKPLVPYWKVYDIKEKSETHAWWTAMMIPISEDEARYLLIPPSAPNCPICKEEGRV